jgi:hypothetical protein
MLKDLLATMHTDTERLVAFLRSVGILDINASKERIDNLVSEIRAELTALGVTVPAPPAPPPPAVDGMKPVDPASQA